MRALAIVVVCSWSALARADMVEIARECPPGQAHVSPPGCPGHGASYPCGPMPCTADAACGAGFRCAPRARCIEAVEIECVGGDGRRPIEERPTFTVSQSVDRGPCSEADACPDHASCSHVGECEAVAPATTAPSPSGTPPTSPTGGACSVGERGAPTFVTLVALVVLAARAQRQRSRTFRRSSRVTTSRTSS